MRLNVQILKKVVTNETSTYTLN